MSDDTLLVVASTAQRSTCKYCRRAIVWVVVARQPGRAARSLPFQASVQAEGAYESVHDAQTTLTFQRWPARELHSKHCQAKPPKDKTRRRLLASSEIGQGRIW